MHTFKELISIMKALRDPDSGCPWDLEQDFHTIAPYTIEEAFEVADAIERNNTEDLCEELGDLLLQVVYHARIAEEKKMFSIDDVLEQINRKMINRHPHVFGNESVSSAKSQSRAWEKSKYHERKNTVNNVRKGVLDDVPLNLPSLTRAQKLQKYAASVGFDWEDITPVWQKLDEEINELKNAFNENAAKDKFIEELGDLLFACVNLARHLSIDAEAALRKTNHKFIQRFNYIEDQADKMGKSLDEMSLAEMDQLWNKAKEEEQTGKGT